MVQFVFGGKSFLSSPSSSAFFALVRAYASIPFSLNCCVPFLTVDKHTHTHERKMVTQLFQADVSLNSDKKRAKIATQLFSRHFRVRCGGVLLECIHELYRGGYLSCGKCTSMKIYACCSLFTRNHLLPSTMLHNFREKSCSTQNPTTFSFCCSE